MYAYFIGGPLDLTKVYLSEKPSLTYYAPVYSSGSYLLTNKPDNIEELSLNIKTVKYELLNIQYRFGIPFILYIYKGIE